MAAHAATDASLCSRVGPEEDKREERERIQNQSHISIFAVSMIISSYYEGRLEHLTIHSVILALLTLYDSYPRSMAAPPWHVKSFR